MKKAFLILLALGGVLLLFVVGMIIYVRLTIPPEPVAEELPSQLLQAVPAPFAPVVEEGRLLARRLLAEERLPGLSLAVAVDGEIVWAEGFRWADVEFELPVTPTTAFRIGGISQTLTAAAVGVLMERGALDLDAPVQSQLPDFPEKHWPLSLRQLMAHCAGLRAHRGEGGLFQGNSCDGDTASLALFASDPLQYEPGTRCVYSTYGWVLVGAVVATVSERPFLDFLQAQVLEPLGMENTELEGSGRNVAEKAHFYYPRIMLNPKLGVHDAPAMDFSCYRAAVGFLSTPTDLVRLGSAMMSEGFLQAATLRELLSPVRLRSGELSGQALGWIVRSALMGSDGAPTRILGQGLEEPVKTHPFGVESSGGQVAGSTATLLIVPDHRVAVAVASNVSGAQNVPLLAERLAESFVRFAEEP